MPSLGAGGDDSWEAGVSCPEAAAAVADVYAV